MPLGALGERLGLAGPALFGRAMRKKTDGGSALACEAGRLLYQRRRAVRVCIVGASGKLGKYMIEHALDRGYDVVGVCREQSVAKLEAYCGRIEIVPGATDDAEVISRAVAGCDGVLVVLAPWGMKHYASGTAQAILDRAPPNARLVFSCGWWPPRDDHDVYSWKVKFMVSVGGRLSRLARVVDLGDQGEATRRVFASDARWTVVRGSDLEEGPSQGLPVWRRQVGDPILKSNRTRRVDFALFMVDALTNDELIREAPAIVGCQTPSALAHAATRSPVTGATGAGRQ
jgi:coenzyme F420-reducing hydrogenase delta subunit